MAAIRKRLSGLVILVGYWRLPVVLSRIRKRWILLRNPHVDIRFGHGCLLGPGFSLHAPEGGRFHAGDWCEFRRDFKVELLGPDASIEMADRCRFTYDTTFSCGTSIVLEDNVTFGRTHVTDEDLTTPDRVRRPIRIGSGATTHGMVTLAAGLGKRVVVGSNAAVLADMPDWSVVGGVPARVLELYGPAAEVPAANATG